MKDNKNLLLFLLKFQELLDSIQNSYTKHVMFQLKPGVSPFKGKALPVDRINVTTLCGKDERLIKLGALKLQLNSK